MSLVVDEDEAVIGCLALDTTADQFAFPTKAVSQRLRGLLMIVE